MSTAVRTLISTGWPEAMTRAGVATVRALEGPLETDSMQLGAIPVQATYVGGEPVWQAA